ncbi:MAG: preprotein translocase subunit SecY [Candidatus Nealsonbacteria bacterium]|nr:preprotein translocase subunit SecY [Candidatus Nealsonbacteria bacterium]
MFEKIIQIFKIEDLRKKILFVLSMFVVFRLMSNIPMPGIDQSRLASFFQDFEIFRFASALTGGALDKFSIVMLGLGPYITATIIMQLLTMIIPQLERLQKEEGDVGRQKINQYGRILTVPFAFFQGFAMLTLFQREGVILPLSSIGMITSLLIITAGTVLLMWIGELITKRGIGNGVSLLIFAAIIAEFPGNVRNMILSITDQPGALQSYFLLFAMIILIIIGVVYFNEARRNIPVSYAKQVRGMKMYGGASTYLPLNLNPAGVIPIIFAFSIAFLPSILVGVISGVSSGFLAQTAQMIGSYLESLWVLGSIIFILVFLFTYFYTAVTFDPKNVAENLQKMGGFIPGIRPGAPTAKYLNHILNRVLFLGGFFLAVIAVMPWIVQGLIQVITGTGIEDFGFLIGGASVLIIVSVVLETMKQVKAQLQMREYETF